MTLKRTAIGHLVSPYDALLDTLLPLVSKPSRYLGSEVNAVHKDLEEVHLRFALAFPDTYEIGMSHLGFRILYHLINRRHEAAAERFFCPWPDLEAMMREREIPLLSQESRTPLDRFDVVGFSIPYEMGYTNVLHMLALGRIPLLARERRSNFPLVIAGGPCAVNPEPLAPFMDAFLVGDGEEAVDDLLDLFVQAKMQGWPKDRLLEGLARIQGVYVPSLFDVECGADGSVTSFRPLLPGYDRVSRRIAQALDPLPYPTDVIVPYTEIIHDRVSLEIARGCSRGCRFCQAGFTYRPVRERSVARILELTDRSLRETGHDDLSLLSLSSGDHTCVGELMAALSLRYVPERVAISFPSLRIGSLSDEIMEIIKEVRKTGITMAPEAGTERLRLVINKDVEEEEVVETARRVFGQGWLSMKLYFMIGLPTETQEDLEGIVDLCERVLREAGPRKQRGRLSVSLSTFVPKPHTPFQWAIQMSLSETQIRLDWLRRQLKRRGIQVKWQEPHLSLLEGAFARGDRRLSPVLLRAHSLGCRLDGWSEHLRFDLWEQAFTDCGIPLEPYVTRSLPMDKVLPWAHLHMGVSQEFLLEEQARAMAGQRTPDCRGGECKGCAVCDQERISVVLASRDPGSSPFPGMNAFQGVYHRTKGWDIRRRFRVRYTKMESARLLSHLELNNVIVRALRRAEVPLRFSQGFHPMPRMDFGPALPVGVESLAEFFDFETFGFVDPAQLLAGMKRTFPGDVKPVACDEIPVDAPSLFRERARTTYELQILAGKGPAGAALVARVKEFLDMPACTVRRVRKDGNKVQEVDIRPLVERVTVEAPDTLRLQIITQPEGGVRLLEVVGALLGLEERAVRGLRINKTQVEFLFNRGDVAPASDGQEGTANEDVLRTRGQCHVQGD
jgi:radical SAM family uncharacterized protein/radical SAM-linked protein